MTHSSYSERVGYVFLIQSELGKEENLLLRLDLELAEGAAAAAFPPPNRSSPSAASPLLLMRPPPPPQVRDTHNRQYSTLSYAFRQTEGCEGGQGFSGHHEISLINRDGHSSLFTSRTCANDLHLPPLSSQEEEGYPCIITEKCEGKARAKKS